MIRITAIVILTSLSGQDVQDGKPETGAPTEKPASSPPSRDERPAGDLELPWRLDRPFKYSWYTDKTKTGSILVTYSKVDDPSGTFYRLASHRRHSHEGRGLRSESEFDFRRDLTPLRYKDDAIVTHARGGSRQDWRITFSGRSVRSTAIQNERSDEASTVETEVPRGTLLFASGALEQWALFALKLDRKAPTMVDAFYPLFGRAVKIDFEPVGSEEIEIGGEKIRALRFDWVYPEFLDKGSIWIDERGRLLEYRSGPLTLRLDSV